MQRIRERVTETNNTTLAILIVAFILLLILILPQVIPGGRFGVVCSQLANPIPGGNNQSILASRSDGALTLGLELNQRNLTTSDNLIANVTFNNTGVGAITLFLNPNEVLLRNDGSAGLHFEIMRVSDQTIFSERADLRPAPPQRTTFPSELLHILGPRQRCTEILTFETFRLADLGLPAGSYRITAVYRNTNRGQITAPAANGPIFPDQGVYTVQELRSNPIEFTIG